MALITSTTLLNDKALLAAVFAAGLVAALQERGALQNVQGMFTDVGTANDSGSTTVRENYIKVDPMVARTEGDDAPAADLNLSDSEITVSDFALRHDITDIGEAVGSIGIDVPGLSRQMVTSADLCFSQVACNTINGITNTVGNSTDTFSADLIYAGAFQMTLFRVNGPFYAVLFPQAWGELDTSLRSEIGVAIQDGDISRLLPLPPGDEVNFKGRWLNINFFTHGYVTNGSGAYNNALWGIGAMGYRHGTVKTAGKNTILFSSDRVTVEAQRHSEGGSTKIVGSRILGMGIREQGRAVRMLSKVAA